MEYKKRASWTKYFDFITIKFFPPLLAQAFAFISKTSALNTFDS